MASERRRDETASHNTDLNQPPFPLPPGWVYHPASPNASVENVLKLAGIFHHRRPIKVASIFDDDADRDTQDLFYGMEEDDRDARV